jgi:hypothetical protein
MGHTLPISHHYYQATVSTDDAIDTFNRISKTTTKKDPAADKETKKIRRSWRPSEVNNIKSFFPFSDQEWPFHHSSTGQGVSPSPSNS